MALDTFNNLLTSVQTWIDRSDIDSALLDDFCQLTERKLYKQLRVKEMKVRLETQWDGLYNDLPTNYLFGLRIRKIGQDEQPIEYRTPQALDDTKTRGGNDKARLFTINNGEAQLDQGIDKTDTETIVSLTSSGTTATMTTADPHNITVGDSVTVSGATETEYNGTFEVQSVPDTTSFTYAISVATTSPATGTITYVVNNVEITYYAKFPGLRESNQTNDILTNYPDLYLYGCLSESGLYTQDAEVLNFYMGKFTEAIELANQETQDAEVSGSDMVMRTIQGFYNNQ